MDQKSVMKEIVTELKQVPDPELGVNIVDLGLVYGILVNSAGKQVKIEMSLSTPSCPLGDIIMMNVRTAVESVLPGYQCEVRIVWDPAWNTAFLSEAAKSELGL